MRTLIVGIGNLLLSDEGFGVHFIRHLERGFRFPKEIELLDAGTSGILITYHLEEADRVYLIDALAGPECPPGSYRRYTKEEFLWKPLPVRLSPHEIGLREMLWLAEMRGHSSPKVSLLGVAPVSTAPGTELTPLVQQRVVEIARELAQELGVVV